MGQQVNELMQMLQASLAQTLGVLAVLSEAELDEHSEHPCAMGGSLRDLLTHNIDHERMHTGQVFSARYSQRKMQFSQVDRLMAETLKARVELIAALIGLPDDALDARMPDEQWTVRQMIEHTIYWERHSIDELARTQLRGRAPANDDVPPLEVTAPNLRPTGKRARFMTIPVTQPSLDGERAALKWKLWIYTNYDCNLRCSYCVAKSGPNVLRRAIGLANVRRLVDEAVALCFDQSFSPGRAVPAQRYLRHAGLFVGAGADDRADECHAVDPKAARQRADPVGASD